MTPDVAAPVPTEPPRTASTTVQPALRVDRLSKTFRIPHRQVSTLKERVLHPFQARTFEELHAVDEVSFEVAEGEFFGIVGRNGSGKSTLLKCLAGIYEIDSGDVEVRGRLSPFIELGVGFNPDLTARENVLINAIMLGLTRREARERFDDIVRFAELEQFLDLRLKNYSSGMHVRLAFSIAIQVNADILLVDEVLAVGDAAFQQKCFDEFHRLKSEGRTIVFVTHDMGAVERFCDRAMLLDRGALTEIGEPRRIARAYNELNFGGLVHGAEPVPEEARGSVEIVDAWFEDGHGERVSGVGQHEELRLAMEVRFHAPLDRPVFGFSLRNDVGHTVFVTTTAWEEVATGSFDAGATATVRVRFENVLATVRHTLTPSVALPSAPDAALDMREDLATVVVHGARATGALVDLPHSYEIERG